MADPPGTIRRIPDPHAEMHRLGRERQVAAGQVCSEEERCRDADHETGAGHCMNWHAFRRTHDPAHCDRVHGGGKDAA